MAFNKNQLSKIANLSPLAGGAVTGQVYHYNAGADAVTTVVAAGYFNEVRGLLSPGDLIHTVAATNAAFRVIRVATVPKTGDVTVAALAFS